MEKLEKAKNIVNFISAGICVFAGYGLCVLLNVWWAFFLPGIILGFGSLAALLILNGLEKFKNKRKVIVPIIIVLDILYLVIFPKIHGNLHFFTDVFEIKEAFSFVVRDITVFFSQALMFISIFVELAFEAIVFNKKKKIEHAKDDSEFSKFNNLNSKKNRKVVTYFSIIAVIVSSVFAFIYFYPGVVTTFILIPFIALTLLLGANFYSNSVGSKKGFTILISILWLFLLTFLITVVADIIIAEFAYPIECYLCGCFLIPPVLSIPILLILEIKELTKYKTEQLKTANSNI